MIKKIIVCNIVFGTFLFGISHAEEINPVVGKTSDFIIRSVDLERLVAGQSPDVQKRFQDDPEQRVNLVKQLLTQKAVVAKARKEGFDKKPDFKEQLSYVVDDFITREYLAKVVAASAVTREEDLKKYYKEKESTFVILEKIKLRHILLEVSKALKDDERSKVLKRAEAALQRVKKGEDFAAVAKDVSEDKDSAARGGELGTISPGSTSSEEFEKAAFALKAGEVSGVVTTPFGFHIIKVDERIEKRTASFDEAKEYITGKVRAESENRKVQEFIEQVTKESGLEVFADKITGKTDKGPENEKPK